MYSRKQLILSLFSTALLALSAAETKKTPKKFVYAKYEEAVAAATASDRPILVFCTVKETPLEEFLAKKVMTNPYFMKEFVKPNCIVCHLRRPAVKGAPWPDPTGLSSDAIQVLNDALRSPRCEKEPSYRHLYPGVVLLDSTGRKTLGAFLREPKFQQPRPDTPLNFWLQTTVYFFEACNLSCTVSPALKKYMETYPDDKRTKEGKR